jgi:hypothetical protein
MIRMLAVDIRRRKLFESETLPPILEFRDEIGR